MFEDISGIIYENKNKEVVIGAIPELLLFTESIVLPDTVKVIETNAFKNVRTPQTTLTIPSSCEIIKQNAFKRAAFKDIIIKEGLKKIESYAFHSTTADSIVLPTTLKVIPECAFNDAKIRNINLENVISIGRLAFYKSFINSVTLSENLIAFGELAFEDCRNLKEVSYNSSILIPGGAFKNCVNLEKFEINAKPKRIGIAAFNNCGKLKEINLPDSLKVIGATAFQNSGLEKILIPSHVAAIGEYAFHNCIDLKEIIIEDSERKEGLVLGKYCFCHTAVRDLVIPHSVNDIDEGIVSFTESLESLTVLANVEKIPYDFAHGCSSLKSLELTPNIKLISDEAFADTGFTELTSGFENVELIGEQSFKNCRKLEKVLFSPKCEKLYLSSNIFENCNNLKEIFMLGNLTGNEDTFYNINDNVKIYISGNFEFIGLPNRKNFIFDKEVIKETLVEAFPFRKASKLVEILER